MKHAFLIIAHHEYPLLKVLLSMLDDSRNDVFLHVDRRSDELYESVRSYRMKHAGFHLLSDRIRVWWGDITQLEVEYLLFETAYRNGPYAYYHLLSGVDLPIKSQDALHAFFDVHQGREFVGYWDSEAHRRDLERKVHRYYFFNRYYKDRTSPLRPFLIPLRNIALALQKVVHSHRSRIYEFKKGGNWVSITNDFCGYLIVQKELVLRRFKYTLCPDEIFLQTVLWNSAFRRQIYNPDTAQDGSMRLIDWERGKPYVWTGNDVDELLSSTAFFARKFSSAHGDVVEAIRSACS